MLDCGSLFHSFSFHAVGHILLRVSQPGVSQVLYIKTEIDHAMWASTRSLLVVNGVITPPIGVV